MNTVWLVVILILFWPSTVFAQDCTDPHQQCGHEDAIGNVVGDTIVGGDSVRALGLSNALGDVDIGDCVVTTQYGIIIFSRQGYHYNLWCMATQLDATGNHEAAAKLRCGIKKIRKTWPTLDACLNAMYVGNPTFEIPDLSSLYTQAARYDASVLQQQERIDSLEQQVEEQRGQYEELYEQAHKQTPASAPDYTKRDKFREILKAREKSEEKYGAPED